MFEELDEVEERLSELAADVRSAQRDLNGADDQRLRDFELLEAGGLRSGEGQSGRRRGLLVRAASARLLGHLLLLLLSLHLFLERALLLDDLRPTGEERRIEQLARQWLVILTQMQTRSAQFRAIDRQLDIVYILTPTITENYCKHTGWQAPGTAR